LVAGTPKNAPTVLSSQGDDAIRPVAPGNARIGNTDTGVRPVTPENARIGTDDSIRPVAPGSARIGTDDSVKPVRSKLVTPSAKISTQNDESI
jgi:hypothetical protein